MYRMCVKNKCAVCAMYSVHIAYICAFRNTPFIYLEIVYLPSQDQRILRALVKITTRQIRSVCKCYE